jgi:hypothetical protein
VHLEIWNTGIIEFWILRGINSGLKDDINIQRVEKFSRCIRLLREPME